MNKVRERGKKRRDERREEKHYNYQNTYSNYRRYTRTIIENLIFLEGELQ